MSYRNSSLWNELNELRCLLAFKRLSFLGFPYGKQSEYAQEISVKSGLSVGNISAKICNYKSVAGVNKDSNASKNTIDLFHKYEKFSIEQVEKAIKQLE
ncbi:putative uncharacterized protein [Aliivibrio wodanis]|uniref:Uncharacterized protein n=1 Tax=Aliivibrio wodanis TaxID=80852 RepID=A0A090K0C2_9GAMM|nr:putative uncharacterized protein [Aliivibrio wodanis]